MQPSSVLVQHWGVKENHDINETWLNKRANEQGNGWNEHYNSWYISLPSSAKQEREMTNSVLSGEREPRRVIISISIYVLFQIYRRVPDLGPVYMEVGDPR